MPFWICIKARPSVLWICKCGQGSDAPSAGMALVWRTPKGQLLNKA